MPERGGRSGSDGDTSLLLLDHPVHGGGTLVHFTDPVRLSRIIQDPLGRSRLSGIDVGHDTDIPGEAKVSLCHSTSD